MPQTPRWDYFSRNKVTIIDLSLLLGQGQEMTFLPPARKRVFCKWPPTPQGFSPPPLDPAHLCSLLVPRLPSPTGARPWLKQSVTAEGGALRGWPQAPNPSEPRAPPHLPLPGAHVPREACLSMFPDRMAAKAGRCLCSPFCRGPR